MATPVVDEPPCRSNPLTFTTSGIMRGGLHLMSLPLEIRLTIYKHFFIGQPRLISFPYNRPFELIEERHWKLLLASKGVYREALPEYYRNCIFGLYELNVAHLQKLLKDMAHTHLARYAGHLLVWRLPEPAIFETLDHVKWVKLVGITCGVEPDVTNGQIYTHSSLMKALRKARAPGFTWDRCREVCQRYCHINFMVDFRCDYPETKLGADGNPQRRWIKTNFTYDVRADTFVEETRYTRKQEGLVLRPQ